MQISRQVLPGWRSYSSALVAMGPFHSWAINGSHFLHQVTLAALPALILVEADTASREEAYNILWALVFGFATLNILSLGARRFEQKRGLNFGELLAILVVIVSVTLLGWEMLYVFHILPFHLTPRSPS